MTNKDYCRLANIITRSKGRSVLGLVGSWVGLRWLSWSWVGEREHTSSS